ncbi:MAG: type ISP restriction/modification enzyme [Saprospiraceae bacterium]
MSKIPKLSQVFHYDLRGKREFKYDFLNENSLSSIEWNKLEPKEPNYFLVKKDFDDSGLYELGFKVDELFLLYASGIKTQRDDASIKFTQQECDQIKKNFLLLTNEQLIAKYGFKDVRDWTIDGARSDLQSKKIIANRVAYRPFDNRFMNFTGKTKGVQGYPRLEVMKNLLNNENLCLITCRQQSTFDFQHVIVTRLISDMCTVSSQTKEGAYTFPLYVYQNNTGQQTIEQTTGRTPNLNTEIVNQIAEKLGLTFMAEKENGNLCFATSNDDLRDEYKQIFAPIDILDYIYAVLHSPTYREKYKEFLKIDFPRVPYPKDATTFWKLVKLGGEIRQIHLLESPVVEQYITQYPEDGDNKVTKPKYEDGKVYINASQYFANVPQVAWEFYIGGYQPAQKWLKDRKGRKLEFDDILHYQKIIVALFETDRMMKEIDAIDIEG